MKSMLLEVDRHRVRLNTRLEMRWEDEIFTAETCFLDTGSAIAVIAPGTLLECKALDYEHPKIRKGKVQGHGKAVESLVFQGALQFGHQDWFLNVDVHVVTTETEWWLGMPVLQHFDLLLRNGKPGERPAIVASMPFMSFITS